MLARPFVGRACAVTAATVLIALSIIGLSRGTAANALAGSSDNCVSSTAIIVGHQIDKPGTDCTPKGDPIDVYPSHGSTTTTTFARGSTTTTEPAKVLDESIVAPTTTTVDPDVKTTASTTTTTTVVAATTLAHTGTNSIAALAVGSLLVIIGIVLLVASRSSRIRRDA